MKKVLAFDLDMTLNVAKTPLTREMAEVFNESLRYFPMCVISGQKYDQFVVQLIEPLMAAGVGEEQLENLHLMVAQGTQYYVRKDGEWRLEYNEALTEIQADELAAALEKAAKELGYWEEDKLAAGDEIIENRESMMAFSALGQKAGVEAKMAWDPDMKKRNAIAELARKEASAYEFEVGGTTTINAFLPGMNKVFGMTKLMERLGVGKGDILYFGDMTQPGGNDYPVVEMGIEVVTVERWEDTAYALRGVNGVVG
ncbi:HAD-IIB family hydrolase [Candidatus Saccharibacteria bacterium]|nr:HAD-IIB family hydrolase [Candidatus Saccharibacteria bacterium]